MSYHLKTDVSSIIGIFQSNASISYLLKKKMEEQQMHWRYVYQVLSKQKVKRKQRRKKGKQKKKTHYLPMKKMKKFNGCSQLHCRKKRYGSQLTAFTGPDFKPLKGWGEHE